MAHKLNIDNLTNPVFSIPDVSVRDPAAIWHDGTCYLYYTRHIGEWSEGPSWDIGVVTTDEFRSFSDEKIITPEGYASPANIVRLHEKWVMPIQSYPWPSEIALITSDNLVDWSAPTHIVPADTGAGWDPDHGPIDGWLFHYGDLWYCAWVNFLAGTEFRAFGLSTSYDFEQWHVVTPHQPFVDGTAYRSNGGIENCAILHDDGLWHFFVSVGVGQQRLAHVASTDPFDLPKVTEQCEIDLKKPDWCRYSQQAIFADDWRHICGKYAMIYHGMSAADERASFGLAFSDDLWNWSSLPPE